MELETPQGHTFAYAARCGGPIGLTLFRPMMLSLKCVSVQDLVASMFVLWRFWNTAESEAGARANEDRELRANVCIAFIVSPTTAHVYVVVLHCCRADADLLPDSFFAQWKQALRMSSHFSAY